MLDIHNEKCSGCMLCGCICPVNAISYEFIDGFRYPKIDEQKCVQCGLCEKKCPAINECSIIDEFEQPKVYAAYTKDLQQRISCTSGGVCYELSKYIIQNGGYVAGVAWQSDFKDAGYILVHSVEELHAISQTKYFQPHMNEIYIQVKELLDNNETVLFIGTACSNAALGQYLSKKYDNLICCDFICRGYTSQVYHEKRIKHLENTYGSKIKFVQYKNKDRGWSRFGTKFTFENQNEIFIGRENDPYELMFSVCDLNTRPSCYACKYRINKRKTDITVGDFWGLKGSVADEEKNGVSAVLINTKKGEAAFKNIEPYLKVSEHSYEEVLKGNPALLGDLKVPKGSRHKFFLDMERSFVKFEKKYGSYRMIRAKRIKYMISQIARVLIKCDVVAFIRLNFFTKEIIRAKRKFIIPYHGARVEIQRGSCVIVNENIEINTPKHRKSNEQAYLKVMKNGKLEINGKVNLAANVTVEVLNGAEMHLGRVETNYGVTIICSNQISIGNDVAIGRNVMIYDSNYHPTSFNNNRKMKPLIIKNHVWICSGVTIAKGITINEGAICGINSTVTRNVISKDLIMGNPARVVMSNMEW